MQKMFKAAGPAEIVRSHQKDDFYLSYLRKTAADVVHALIGISLHEPAKEIKCIFDDI